MRLKKLELIGFKSFADRTEIHFDEGVTCVVGPNGCGKSNISDAIRWVLGERSAKLLRGSRMEDVIFNGTDFRKLLAMAEVSLTINNSDRGLPIDYKEVTLTRRLHRSGESEYLINRTACRLKDIQDLILDTGIGSNSYSMIEQGRIDYILNTDAEERRFLIEEAAGISKYKVKKEEAIRKLERTEGNLLRLKDIVHEVHKNIQYAERQARRAERYKEQFEKLKDLEIRRAFQDLARLAEERASVEAEHGSCQATAQKLAGDQEAGGKSQASAAASLREILERYSKQEIESYKVQSQREQNENALRFHEENRLELARRRGQIQQELKELEARFENYQRERAVKEREVSETEEDRERTLTILKSSEETLQDMEKRLDEAKRLQDENKEETFRTASEAAKIRSDYQRVLAILETGEDRRRRQEGVAKRFQQEREEWQTKKQACEKEMHRLEKELAELDRQKQNGSRKLQAFDAQREQVSQTCHEAERALHEKETRLGMLAELDADSTVNCEALASEIGELEQAFVKTSREVFTVKEGYEWALDVTLGAFARSLIAEDMRSAEKILAWIKERRPSSVGLFIRELAKPNGLPTTNRKPSHPCIRYAVKDVVAIRPGYEDVFAPFFQNVYIAESFSPSDLKDLLALADANQLITAEGLRLGPHGRIYYSRGAHGSGQGLFRQDSEMRSLESEITKLKNHRDETHRRIEAVKAEQKQGEKEIESLETQILNAKIQKEASSESLKGIEDRLASLNRELELLDFESKEFTESEEKAREQQELLTRELSRLETNEKELRERQEALSRNQEAADQKKAQAFKGAAGLRARFESFEERNRLVREAYDLLASQEKRDRERLAMLEEEGISIGEKEGHLGEEDKKIKGAQAELKERLVKLDVALEMARQERERAEAEMGRLTTHLQMLRERHHELEDRLHQFEMRLMDLNYRERATHERFSQAYQVSLADLRAEDFPLGDRRLEEVEAAIEELKTRLESLGAVNLLAIEEYEELKQRYDFLLAQQKDLEKAREELLEAIRKINRTTKSLFEETFTHVQKTFQEYYEILFRGGEARLVMVDEEDPLESGIDIVVRPPGKKLQHITLLSGGEKAMTAIALLFALFKIKPSPFCVLDEVDASLDEANIDRFLTVLRTFLESSQFIITTHSRKTIAMGDSLYGVTMEEAGISKIVSVKVNPVENPVPA